MKKRTPEEIEKMLEDRAQRKKERLQRWYQANKKKQLAYVKKWRRDNPEKYAAHQAKDRRQYFKKYKAQPEVKQKNMVRTRKFRWGEFAEARVTYRKAKKVVEHAEQIRRATYSTSPGAVRMQKHRERKQMAKKVMSADDLKSRLGSLMDDIKNKKISSTDANAISHASREFMRVVSEEIKIARMLGKKPKGILK